MRGMFHYVYISKDSNDFSSFASSAAQPMNLNGHEAFLLSDSSRPCFVLHEQQPACDELAKTLKNGQDDAVRNAVRTFFDVCDQCGVVQDSNVIFLIHFGGHGEGDCRRDSRRMWKATADDPVLARHLFISVSKYNSCPTICFKDSALRLPEDKNENSVRKRFEQWANADSTVPDYDHLRGISILCQALLEMNLEEREEKLSWPGMKWWRQCLWSGKRFSQINKDAFTQAELAILESGNGKKLKHFCSCIINYMDMKEYSADECLRELISVITKEINKI